MAPLPMPLNDLEGYLETFLTPIPRETYNKFTNTSRGPSAVAELLVST